VRSSGRADACPDSRAHAITDANSRAHADPAPPAAQIDSRGADVLAGTRALGDLRDARRNPTALARENNRKLAAWLRGGGHCAFAGQEAIFITDSGLLWLEYHAAAETDGGWTQNPFKGAHTDTSASAVSEPPDAPAIPEVAEACPIAPCPIREWSAETLPEGWGSNELGQSAWKWNWRLHTMGNNDSTPVTRNQEPFCRAIGMSPMADGNLRAGCPVRPDGHPERVVVETWLLRGGAIRDSRNGQDCTPNNTDNPMAWLAKTGNCRICNATKTTCSDWN